MQPSIEVEQLLQEMYLVWYNNNWKTKEMQYFTMQ